MSREINDIICQVTAGGIASQPTVMRRPGSQVSVNVPTNNGFFNGMRGNDSMDGSTTVSIREIEPPPTNITIRLSKNGGQQTSPVNVDPNWTVDEFKRHLKETVGVNNAASQMTMRIPSTKTEMRNSGSTLASYGVTNNTRIEVLDGGLRGG